MGWVYWLKCMQYTWRGMPAFLGLWLKNGQFVANIYGLFNLIRFILKWLYTLPKKSSWLLDCYVDGQFLTLYVKPAITKFLHWTRNFLCSTWTMELPSPFNDFLLGVCLIPSRPDKQTSWWVIYFEYHRKTKRVAFTSHVSTRGMCLSH